MKAILEFDLNDRDDNLAHNRCVKALDLVMALMEIDEELRVKIKYGDLTEEQYDTYEKVREFLHDTMNERGIFLNDLVI